MKNLPLYTIDDGTNYYDCVNSTWVKKILWKIREKDAFHRLPKDIKIYTWSTWEDITSEFIKGE